MEILKNVVAHPSFWGFCLGFLLFALSVVAHWKTKREYRRFQRHLSDKMELEAKQYSAIREEKEILKKENENFRLKVGQLTEKPDAKINLLSVPSGSDIGSTSLLTISEVRARPPREIYSAGTSSQLMDWLLM